MSRLQASPPDWPVGQTTEACAMLLAAQQLVKAVGEAIRQAQ